MKALRLLILGLAGLLILAGLALAIALDGRVQTWALKRRLERAGGAVTVARASIGFSDTEIDGLRLERGGAVLDLPRVEAELPALAALLNHRYYIRSLVATGWTLDLRNAPVSALLASGIGPGANGAAALGSGLVALARADDPAARLPDPFRGIFYQLSLPVDVAIGDVRLEGDVLLPPGPGTPAARMHVSIEGGGLSSGNQGRFVFRASVKPEGPAPVDRIQAEGALTAAMDSPRTFTRVAVRMNASAFGAKFASGVRMIADASAARSDDGESYSIVLSGESKPLLALLADVPYDGQRPSGTWRLSVADEDLSPFLLGRELPSFDVAGEGQIDADPRGADVHISGGLRASLDKLAAAWPRLAAVGAVDVLSDFDITRRRNLWRIDRLTAAVRGAEPLLTLRSLQAFAFDPATGELQVANVSADLFGVSLQAVPPQWLQAFFPGLVARGDAVRGEIVGLARSGGLSLRTRSPLTVARLSLEALGHPVLSEVDGSLGLSTDYAPEGWQVAVDAATLRSGGALLASGSFKIGRRGGTDEPLKLEGAVRADLAAVERQPAFAGAGLSQGALSAEYSASLGANRALQARVRLSGLQAATASGPSPLPDIAADVRADMGADGRILLHAPIVIGPAARSSSLVLDGAAGWGLTGPRFEGRLSGARLAVSDLEPFVGALAAPSGDATTATAASQARVGGAWSAQLELDLGRVVLAPLSLARVTGQLQIAPGLLAWAGVNGRLEDGASVTTTGRVGRASGADARGYAARGQIVAKGLDAAAWFKRYAPDRVPAVEGQFDVSGGFEGAGATAAEAVESSQGAWTVSSRGGHFRLLETTLAPKSGGGNIALDALRTVASTVGSVIGRHHGEFSNPAEAAIYTAKAVSDIAYDQVTVRILRDASRDIVCRDFTLISPETRLVGGAHLHWQEGSALADDPLEARFELRARGKLAASLKYLDVLGDKPDDLGYRPCLLEIDLKGSLRRPDASSVQTALMKIVTARGQDLLNKLLGK